MTIPKQLHDAAPYLLTALLSAVIAGWVLDLRGVDLDVPLEYSGDALNFAADVKHLRENGLRLTNPALGAPGQQNMAWFPHCEALHSFLLVLLGVFTSSFGSTFNAYYLLTFPAVALSAQWTLRRLGLSVPCAVSGGLLFTFLYGHFARGLTHLPYSAYFLVPLSTLPLLAVAAEDAVFFRPSPGAGRRSLGAVACVGICFLLASASAYYAFFFCFLLLLSGVAASLRHQRRRHAAAAAILVASTVLSLGVSLSPYLLGRLTATASPAVAARDPYEAERYGLKVAQLVLPSTHHRLTAARELKAAYNRNARVVDLFNENDGASLGGIATVGFVGLLAFLVGRLPWRLLARADERRELLANLAILNAGALLLGTVGGLGSLFALLISPQIRAYNRISVFIAFYGLAAVLVVLDEVYRRRRRAAASRLPWAVSLATLTGLGLLDQIPISGRMIDLSRRAAEEETFAADRRFVKRIEARTGPGARVFQLPYHRFPEHGPQHRMRDYDPLAGYLHSSSLRWSYGAMRGSPADLWQGYVASRPPAEMIDYLRRAGFAGIWLDRWGYPDNGAAVVAGLTDLVAEPAVESAGGRRVFLPLSSPGDPASPRPGLRDAAPPVFVADWAEGCYWLEGTIDDNRRWCGSRGSAAVVNLAASARSVELEMAFVSGSRQPAKLTVEGDLLAAELTIDATPRPTSHRLLVPPGVHRIELRCDAAPLFVRTDTRHLVFWIDRFRVSAGAPP